MMCIGNIDEDYMVTLDYLYNGNLKYFNNQNGR